VFNGLGNRLSGQLARQGGRARLAVQDVTRRSPEAGRSAVPWTRQAGQTGDSKRPPGSLAEWPLRQTAGAFRFHSSCYQNEQRGLWFPTLGHSLQESSGPPDDRLLNPAWLRRFSHCCAARAHRLWPAGGRIADRLSQPDRLEILEHANAASAGRSRRSSAVPISHWTTVRFCNGCPAGIHAG
jgi:hypothetical protein